MKMKMKQKSGMEFKVLNQELKENADKIDEGIHEGNKLESDKQKLEAQIDRIYNSDLPIEDKKAILNELKAEVAELQSVYRTVEKNIQDYQADSQAIIEQMDANASVLEKQASDLKEVQLESGAADLSKAIDETEKKKQEFSSAAEEAKARLHASIETTNAINRSMMRKRFSGK